MTLQRKTPLSRSPIKRKTTRKCAICRQEFAPWREGVPTCEQESCRHAYALSVAEKSAAKRAKEAAKAERESVKARKEKIKNLSQLAKDAEHYVNRYVRLRDAHLSCVSCDRPASWDGQWHASHLKSVGANSFLRFHLWNIHKACSVCNNHLSGNIAEYSKRLPLRIGADKFEFLQTAPRERKFSRDYLIRLKSVAMKACKRLEKRRAYEMQD